MRDKLIEYKINDRWSVSSDKWNWILLEYSGTKRLNMTFYSSLKQLSEVLLDLKAKDSLSRLSISKGKNAPTAGLDLRLMDKITQDLIVFLQEVTHNERKL